LALLTQDNTVKLIIAFLVAIFSAIGYFWTQSAKPTILPNTSPTVTQTTSGKNGLAISGTQGDVTITINGSPTEKQPQ
jgi:hypothetical protein